jgi:hypothetical protein
MRPAFALPELLVYNSQEAFSRQRSAFSFEMDDAGVSAGTPAPGGS